MYVRKFKNEDAKDVISMIIRNFLEVNIKDYPLEEMESLAKSFDEDRIINQAKDGHTYVVCDESLIVGTGTIAGFWGSETESILLTIFVLPEYHGKGVGSMIMEALEKDEYFFRANRIEIPASITACEFYEKFGYSYKNNKKELDEHNIYRMEKHR